MQHLNSRFTTSTTPLAQREVEEIRNMLDNQIFKIAEGIFIDLDNGVYSMEDDVSRLERLLEVTKKEAELIDLKPKFFSTLSEYMFLTERERILSIYNL